MQDSFKFIWWRYVWSGLYPNIYHDLTVLLPACRIYVVFCLYGIYQAIFEHDLYNQNDIPIDRWSVLFDIGCIALTSVGLGGDWRYRRQEYFLNEDFT